MLNPINETIMERIPAPIDNKNICEDGLDSILEDLYPAPDHYKDGERHKVGFLQIKDKNNDHIAEAYVDVQWRFADNSIHIKMLAYNDCVASCEDTRNEVYEYYTRFFKEWECPENEDLEVICIPTRDRLVVSLYFKCEDNV